MNQIHVLAITGCVCLMCTLAMGQTSPVGKLVFEDAFADMSNWVPEGPHKVHATGGRLRVTTDTVRGQIGQYVWCKRELPADFRLEFDVTPASSSGFFLIFFCVQGVNGEGILGKELIEDYMPAKDWKEYYDWDKYTSDAKRTTHQSRIRSYHISYRRNEQANCNLRKNPGLILKKSSAIESLLPKDKTAHVVLSKVGGHITLAVDGRQFMDWTDDQPPYNGGKFGFRNVYDSDAYYSNVKLFDLGK